MDKIYHHKQLSIDIDVADSYLFKGDDTDLLELCGNLLDNACKAAQSRIRVQVTSDTNWLTLSFDNDGPGIADDKKHFLLERGTRLDTYTEGQGIGLALVSDLVSIYEGKLRIEDSDLGGARIIIQFPNH
jgi:two-component system sensor histidine kinase PhoQ